MQTKLPKSSENNEEATQIYPNQFKSTWASWVVRIAGEGKIDEAHW